MKNLILISISFVFSFSCFSQKGENAQMRDNLVEKWSSFEEHAIWNNERGQAFFIVYYEETKTWYFNLNRETTWYFYSLDSLEFGESNDKILRKLYSSEKFNSPNIHIEKIISEAEFSKTNLKFLNEIFKEKILNCFEKINISEELVSFNVPSVQKVVNNCADQLSYLLKEEREILSKLILIVEDIQKRYNSISNKK